MILPLRDPGVTLDNGGGKAANLGALLRAGQLDEARARLLALVEALGLEASPPSPCPYLPGRDERKVFAHLPIGEGAVVNDKVVRCVVCPSTDLYVRKDFSQDCLRPSRCIRFTRGLKI